MVFPPPRQPARQLRQALNDPRSRLARQHLNLPGSGGGGRAAGQKAGPGLDHWLPGRRHRHRALGAGPGHHNVQDILHFAEFGVVLMLFLIGLELQPARLWRLRQPIFGWSTMQMLS